MPIKEADFSRDEIVSWHAVEEAERGGAERVILSAAQVRMLTTDFHAVASGRKRADESAFRVPPTVQWSGLTCRACYGPASMSTTSGRTYCSVCRPAEAKEQQATATCRRAEQELEVARRQAEDYRRGAKLWMEQCAKAEEERDAMALALARKEIAK